MSASWTRASLVSAVCVLGCVGIGSARDASADIVPVSLQGVIVEAINGNCTTFEGDDGVSYILSTLGEFSAGDRVHVTGAYDDTQGSICYETPGPLVLVSEIRPAFAGIGTVGIVNEQLVMVSEDGRTFVVENLGGFGPGASVYVQGKVVETRTLPRITANVIGPAFASFGRIVSFTPSGVRFRSDAGENYLLDRPGSLGWNALEGDYIYVEGIVTASGVTRLTPITSVTARPAFRAAGYVVQGASGVAFDPDTLFSFGATYTSAGLEAFAPGSLVYVRGRSADDYDYGEAKPIRNVRKSSIGAAYVGVGTLNRAARTMTNAEDGTVVHLEHIGNSLFNPDGSLVYVAGPIASQGPGMVTVSHNEVRIGVILEGVLGIGFSCSPIIFFNEGGYAFPRNNDGLPLGTHVRVVGGVSFEVPCTDEPGIVGNTIEETPFPCINCE